MFGADLSDGEVNCVLWKMEEESTLVQFILGLMLCLFICLTGAVNANECKYGGLEPKTNFHPMFQYNTYDNNNNQ